MTRTESLIGRLSIHDAEWKAGLAKAATQFRAFSASTGRMMATGMQGAAKGALGIGNALGSGLGKAMGMAGTLVKTLGGIGAVTAVGVAAGIKDVADLGGQLSDTSARTGIAIKDLVLLREQYRQGGIDIGAVTTHIKKMNSALADSGKGDLFKLLKLDRGQLQNAGPVEALNAIISKVRQLGNVAAQQAALTQIFGKGGVEMMTLVADPNSAKNAKKMVGGMGKIMEKSAGDFDLIGDNLFEGLPVKMQQFFTGFTDAVKAPLLAATEAVTNADFSGVGERLGAQLMWAWDIFRGLMVNGDLWAFVGMKLQDGFMMAVSYFVGAMKVAFTSIFSRENLMVIWTLFQAVGAYLGATINKGISDFKLALDPLVYKYAPGPDGQSAYAKDKAGYESKFESAGILMDAAKGLGTDMIGVTIQRLAQGLAEIQPLDMFKDRMSENESKSAGMIYNAAVTRGADLRSPVNRAGGWAPAVNPNTASQTPIEKFIELVADMTKQSTSGVSGSPLSAADVKAAVKSLGQIEKNTAGSNEVE